MRRSLPFLFAAACLAGCSHSSNSGAIHGRVLASDGSPVSGARVMLDRVDGRVALTNVHGEFRLGGASEGTHQVFARANNQAALANADVSGTATADVGDLVLEDCSVIVANGGTTDSGSGSSSGGVATGAPNAEPAATAVDPNGEIPCETDPPPPPPAHVDFAALGAADAFGSVDPSGISGFGWDDSQQVGFDFYIPGDFLSGGSADVTVSAASPMNGPGAYMTLYTADGYAYLLSSGELSVTVAQPSSSPAPTPVGTPATDPAGNGCVAPPPDGSGAAEPDYCIPDETTAHFDFHGTDLSFDYLDWYGNVDAAHTASAPSADASGDAYVFIPPPPPTSDITVADFVADWSSLYLCAGCDGNGGDILSVYAYDSVDQTDLSLWVPTSELVLGGTATITGADPTTGAGPDGAPSGAFGEADYFGGGNYWSYVLDSIDLASGATLASGQPFTLSVANGTFDYLDAYGYGGGVVVAGGGIASGGVANAASTQQTFHLYIDAGDLSGTVDADCGVNPGGPEQPAGNSGS